MTPVEFPTPWFDRANPPRTQVEALDLYSSLGLSVLLCQPGSKVRIKINHLADGETRLGKLRETLDAKAVVVDGRAMRPNLAVLLGEHSGGLIDIDLDIAAMKRLFPEFADKFLPPGAPSFGRRRRAAGHFLYRVAKLSDSGRTKMYGLTPAEAAEARLDAAPGGEDKLKVVEIRSTGGYTVMPGSVLGDDPIVFDRWGTPPIVVSRADLERRVELCAALALILNAYPAEPGNRNEICLALTGALVKVPWLTDDDADWIVSTIARLAGDEESRGGRAADTRAKIESGEPAWGVTKLCELLGFDALRKRLHQWLYGGKAAISPIDTSNSPELRELNERYVLCQNFGGKCRVLEELSEPGLGGRTTLTAQSVSDFRSAHMNRKIVVGSKKGVDQTQRLGDWWLDHEGRRQCRRVVFDPQGQHAPDELNLWTGFKVEAKPGSWRLIRRHLLGNVCNGNRHHYRYLIRWLARMVQRPWEPGFSAIVLRGKEGTGKSIVKRNVMRFFGRHALSVSQPSHLVGNFNAHLRDVVFLAAEEAFFAGDKKHASVLKMIVTEEEIPIEAKGVNVEKHPNRLHLMMLSNEDWVVPASVNDRRFFVLDVSDAHREDHAFFNAIQSEMDSGGLEAWLHDLMHMDLSEFNVRKVPKTEGLREQQRQTLRGVPDWWLGVLESGDLAELRWSPEDGTYVVESSVLLALCRDHAGCEKVTGNQLASFLHRPQGGSKVRLFLDFKKQRANRLGKGRTGPTCFLFPSLTECRERWNAVMGPQTWNGEEHWNGEAPEPVRAREPSLVEAARRAP